MINELDAVLRREQVLLKYAYTFIVFFIIDRGLYIDVITFSTALENP